MFDAFDEGHGRLVRRRVFVAPAVQDLEPLHGWPDLSTVLAMETIRSVNGTGPVEAGLTHEGLRSYTWANFGGIAVP